MMLVLSGEGGSDMGSYASGVFSPGPMAHIVDKLIEEALEFSPLSTGRVRWVSRGELSEVAKTKRLLPHVLLPGVERPAGYAGHTRQASALAWICLDSERQDHDVSVGVMFRDSDGTQSTVSGRWENTVASIELGFSAMSYGRGVPMVPKPKQEAWLLCARKPRPYIDCGALEEESGNDSSPRSLKAQLAAGCGGEPDKEEMCRWILEGAVDVSKLSMPSFDAFRRALHAALAHL